VTIDVAGELANKISISRIYGVAGDLAVDDPEIGVSLQATRSITSRVRKRPSCSSR